MREALVTFLKGVLMGAADIVPGVSGGTIAFITGIYDRLITGIKDVGTFIRIFAAKLLGRTREGWGRIWRTIDFPLFIPLLLGIAVAFAIGSHLIPAAMESYPVAVYSLFIGLVLASAYHVYAHIMEHNWKGWAFGLIGLAMGVAISLLPVQDAGVLVPLPYVFLLGAIAICAMILPGISGSYILLMFGQYVPILNGLKELNIPMILTFMAGAALGILSFARLLSWLLKRYHSATFYWLLGLMLGSLTTLGKVVTGNWAGAASAVTAVIFFIIGAALVLAVELYAKRK